MCGIPRKHGRCPAQMPLRTDEHASSVRLRGCPGSTAHCFDDGGRCDVVEVAGGGGDAGVAELAGDDGDVDAFGAELGGVGVAEAVGVDALLDAGPDGEPYEHRCPKASVEQVAHAVDELASEGSTLESLVQREGLPFTQVAVAPAFLKERGIVETRYRRNYAATGAVHLDAMTEYFSLAQNA